MVRILPVKHCFSRLSLVSSGKVELQRLDVQRIVKKMLHVRATTVVQVTKRNHARIQGGFKEMNVSSMMVRQPTWGADLV